MTHTSLIQILKTGDEVAKTFDGRSYTTQECECILLKDDGSFDCVGVLRLSNAFKGENAPKPGVYHASFSLYAAPKDRKIGAQIAGLVPADGRFASPVGALGAAGATKGAKP